MTTANASYTAILSPAWAGVTRRDTIRSICVDDREPLFATRDRI
jgi:hypothetical protein